MKNGYTNNITFKITFSGMMLGLVILFQFLEKFMPFAEPVMMLNLSLVFIMAAIYVIGFNWALLLLVLRLVLGPAVSDQGYSDIGMWSHFILFTTGLMFMTMFYLLHKYAFKNIKNEKVNLLVTSVISVIAISLIATLLNGVLFTPVFYKIMGYSDGTISDTKHVYTSDLYFGVPNYWGGIFAVYIPGNIVKYTIVSFAFIALWKAIKHYA